MLKYLRDLQIIGYVDEFPLPPGTCRESVEVDNIYVTVKGEDKVEDLNKRLTKEECEGKRWITEEELKEMGGYVDDFGAYCVDSYFSCLVRSMLEITVSESTTKGYWVSTWMVRDEEPQITNDILMQPGMIENLREAGVPASSVVKAIKELKQVQKQANELTGTCNQGTLSEARCTCGATAAGFGIHSDWCDIHKQ